jgi:CBS domain-containing protein
MITEAARLMREHHAGDLIVVDDLEGERRPAGIITDRDIVIEVLGRGLDPAKTKVGEVMGTRVVIASAAEDSASALERMRAHGIRRIPVVDEQGEVLGIVTLDDMLRVHAEQATLLAGVVEREQQRENRNRR